MSQNANDIIIHFMLYKVHNEIIDFFSRPFLVRLHLATHSGIFFFYGRYRMVCICGTFVKSLILYLHHGIINSGSYFYVQSALSTVSRFNWLLLICSMYTYIASSHHLHVYTNTYAHIPFRDYPNL